MIPSIQSIIAKRATDFLSEKYQTSISFKHFYFKPFSQISIDGLLIKDHKNDTLLFVEEANASIDLFEIRNKNIRLNQISFNNPYINIYKENNLYNFNFFQDTSSIKTTSEWQIHPNNIQIINGRIKTIDWDSIPEIPNLSVSKLNLILNHLFLNKDSLSFNLKRLSFAESSNFNLLKGTADVSFTATNFQANNLQLRTQLSLLNFDSIVVNYPTRNDFFKFNDKTSFNLIIAPSLIHPQDISTFINKPINLESSITVQGIFNGKLSNIRAAETNIIFGDESSLRSSFNIIGLPDISNTFVFLDIERLKTNASDISKIFDKLTSSDYVWSDGPIGKLGKINFTGNISGFFTDLVAYGDCQTDLGSISTDLGIKINNRINFSGRVKTHQFNIGKLIDSEKSLGNIGLNISINGSHKTSKDFFAYLDGTIDSVTINQYQYHKIDLNGLFANQKFDGQFDLNDPNGRIHFTGNIDYSKEIPNFNFYAELKDLKLDRLNLVPNIKESSLSLDILSNFEANNISDLTGFIRADNGQISTADDEFILDSLIISANRLGDNKQLSFQSDLFDGEIIGKYNFTHPTNTITNFLSAYRPELFSFNPDENFTNSFSFMFELKKIGELINILNPNLELSKDATISGQFNSESNYLEIEGIIPHIHYKKFTGDNMIFSVKGDENITSLVQFDNLNTASLINFKNFSVQQKVEKSDISTNVFWNSWSSNTNSGSIFSKSTIEKPDTTYIVNIQLDSSNIVLNDTIWNIKPTLISFAPKLLSIDNFRIWHSNQQITIDGSVSDDNTKTLNGFVRNIDLSKTLKNLSLNQINIEGLLNAEFQIKDYFNEPSIIGDILIDDFVFNQEAIGQFYTSSEWNSQLKSLIIESEINNNNKQKLIGSGIYHTSNNIIEYNAVVDSLEVSFLNLYLTKILQNLKGTASGELQVNGKISNPTLTGKVNLNNSEFDVDFLQTSYSLKDSVWFEPERIIFRNMTLKDKSGHTGSFNGYIAHNNFSNMRYNLQLNSNNLLSLNTQQKDNPLYYGTVYSTGTMKITGVTKQLSIDISATTMPNTEFYIPIEETSNASSNNFISFSSSASHVLQNAKSNNNYEIDLSGIEMTMDLKVNPNAQVQIIFDPQTGVALKGKGNGNIQLKIDKYENVLMYGDYNFESGDYVFSLQNLINKKFIINQGSLVQWDGDPYNALVDVNATYKARANLMDLTGSNPNIDYSQRFGVSDGKKRIPINCNINLTDRLSSPNINFGINAPTLELSGQTMLQSYFSSDEDLNRQILSLLLLNKFYTPEGQNTETASNTNNAALTTTYELLSNQLSNLFSQINRNVDIGFSYRPADEITKREIDLALSTQLFNDRVTISTNLGYEEYQTEKEANNIIGDFDMNVKLNKSGTIRAHGYHRTNNDIITSTSPNKQGIGLSFRNEFNSWGELMKRYWAYITRSDNRKKKSNKKE